MKDFDDSDDSVFCNNYEVPWFDSADNKSLSDISTSSNRRIDRSQSEEAWKTEII